MESKKINQLATEMSPAATDLTIIGDPITGVSKKITLEQIASLFAGSVSFYANLAAFPVTGTIDTIYCAKDTNKLYLWSGSAYVQTFPSQALLDTYQLRSEKGASNGYASLDSAGKVPVSQLPSSIMEYKGMWSAATNTPTLANGTGDTGDVYICNAAGSVNFGAGAITFAVGDYVIYSGSIWQRSSGAVGTVTSVGLSTNGNSVTIGSSPITTSGTISANFVGDSTQYINGAGNLTTFPTLLSSDNLVKLVRNQSGATITAGTVIYISGATGNKPLIAKALATGDSTSAQTYGLLQTDIENNADGYVVVIGNVNNLDTSAFTEGQQLYLSGTTAGTYTTTKPYAPIHLVYVGIVLRAHPTMGIIGVKIQNGYEMDELHNVAAQSPNNGDILQYVTSTNLWTKTAGTTTNIAEGTNLYYTDSRARLALSAGVGISYNNTTGVITNSAPDQTVSLTAGAGISVTGTYPSFTIASTITQYTDALARASLSFAAGSGAYNSTTGVITIPTNNNQITNGAGYITGNQTITLSGDVSGSGTTAITTTIGALKVTNAMLAGSIDLTTKVTGLLPDGNISSAATWNAKQNAITLTTTGTSGAATLVGATLNIPQYTDTYTGTVTSVAALTIGTTGTDLSSTVANSTTTPVITLNVPTASATNRGALSSADWTTFNNKQSALTNPVTGTGTTNYLPKFTGTSTIGNSLVYDDGTNVGIGTTSLVRKLTVSGSGVFTDGTNDVTIWNDGSIGTNGNLALKFNTNGTLKATLTPSGNLGLGVTPSAWGSGFAMAEYKGGFIGSQSSSYLYQGQNLYFNGTNWVYATNGSVTMIEQSFGSYKWYNAPSGTAGNAITFTQAMTLTASGRLLINTPTESTYQLDVNGTGRFSGETFLNGRVHGVEMGVERNGSDTVAAGPWFRWTNAATDRQMLTQLNASNGLTTWSYNGTAWASVYTLSQTGAATFSNKVGVGGAAATYSLTAYNGANGTTAAFGGTARGLRIDNDGTFSSGRTTIYGVDNTFYGSYQPLAIGGSELYFSIAGTDRLTIASTGAATFTGNVTSPNLYAGSGTGAPSVQVFGGASSNSIGGSAYITLQDVTNTRFWGIQADASQKLNFWHYNGGWSSVANISSTGAATFSSSVTAGGRLTTSITGGGSINVANFFNPSTTTGDQTYIWIGKDAGATNGRAGLIDFVDNVDGVSGYLALAVAGDNPVAGTGLIVKKGGNVGIGTSSPDSLLEVENASNPSIFITNTGAATLRLQAATGVVYVGSKTADNLDFITGDAPRMRITSGGSVNINNTTNTTYKLSTYNNVEDTHVLIAGLAPSVRFGDTVTGITYSSLFGMATVANNFITGAAAGDFAITWNSANKCFFGYTNTTPLMVIDNGNLGLGTLTIGSKAQINGNMAVGYSSSTAAPTNGILSNGGFKSSAPAGASAATWKLGGISNTTVTHDRVLYVEVGGTTYSILASTTV